MRIAITTYATKRYLYALPAQAPKLIAALRYAGLDEADWIFASDDSQEAKAMFATVSGELHDGIERHHVPLKGLNESPDGQHAQKSNQTIAALQSAAWHHARVLGVDAVWSVESDILPNPNSLRALIDTLNFDRSHYDVAMAAYPNNAFLGGHGDPRHWIAPNVYPEERELPEDLAARYQARLEQERNGPAPDADTLSAWQAMDKEIEACPPKANIFGLQAAGWRPRGWLTEAYPGVGLGAMLPTDWVGLGCTLISARALDLAHWTGYEGNGTQDLWLCWRCWKPAGIRMAVVPHALASHVKRSGQEFLVWYARHELGGQAHGHLRMDEVKTPTPPRF